MPYMSLVKRVPIVTHAFGSLAASHEQMPLLLSLGLFLDMRTCNNQVHKIFS